MDDLKKIFLFIYPFWKKYRKNELLILLALVATFIITLFIPLKFRDLTDDLTGNYSLQYFENALIVFASLIFAKSLINWFYNVYKTLIGESFIIDVTSNVYDAVLHKRRSFWIKYYPNDVLTRLTQDISSIKTFIFDFLHNVFLQGISILGITAILFYLNFRIGLIVSIEVAIVFLITYFGSGYLNKRAVVLRQIASKFTHLFQSGISQPFLIFSWNIFPYHYNKYLSNAREMRKEQITFVNQVQQINQAIAFINLLIGTIVLLFMLYSDYDLGLISIGGVFAILIYSGNAIQSTINLASDVVSTKINRVSIVRIKEIIDYESKADEIIELKEPLCHPFFNNELKDGFVMPEEEKFLYKLNTSNGSGKSTLAQILCRYDDLNGNVLNSSWFLLPSDSIIFEGNLLENINIISGREVIAQQIIETLQAAKLEALLNIFPDGLFTDISSESEKVSRGQKQAAMLISAIVKNPDKIIIDEGLNSLDAELKASIREPLGIWLRDRKSIFIDHEGILDEEKDTIEELAC